MTGSDVKLFMLRRSRSLKRAIRQTGDGGMDIKLPWPRFVGYFVLDWKAFGMATKTHKIHKKSL